MTVEVLQYMRPKGRRVPMTTTINDAFEAPYEVLKMRGWRLAAEVLADGPISLTVEDDEQDFAQAIVENGPEVPRAIERIIAEAIALKPGLDDGFASDDAITTLDEEFDARESAARDTQQAEDDDDGLDALYEEALAITRDNVEADTTLPPEITPEPETPFDLPQENS